MKLLKTPQEVKAYLRPLAQAGKTIGFVPTMGFLHEGHLSLVRKAREENDIVVVSIFVNPTQFGPNEDYASYPRDLKKDSDLIEAAGCDVVFAPEPEAMYPPHYATYADVYGGLTDKLCGASRPGHFKGVATVVTKLFNTVMPTRAYFGQKDAQQVAVIERMTEDLNMDVKIVPCPIVRETDGLAMSSRNAYLSLSERQDALVLSRSLDVCVKAIEEGERLAQRLLEQMTQVILTVESANIDYIQIVNARTLEPVAELKGDILIALAVKIGKTRLIDNTRLEVKSCY